MPTTRAVPALLLTAALGAAAGCGGAGTVARGPEAPGLPPGAGTERDAAVTGGARPVSLAAEMRGGAQVPGPGDPDGGGRATVVLEHGRSQLCYRIELERVGGAGGTFVQHGPAGSTGAVVLGLDNPADGSVEGCVTADGSLLDEVAADPAAYYLNVRSDEYPDGAVRGQLRPAGL
jgi:hypothetical protein